MRHLIERDKSYCVVARDPNGKQAWKSIGAIDDWKGRKRELAQEVDRVVRLIREGKDRSGPQSFAKVVDDFMRRHVAANGLRSERFISQAINKHILPTWGAREFESIRRGDVVRLLDDVEAKSGPVAADRTLAIISKLMRWYAVRHDDYVSPIVPGMGRSNPKDRARDRILNDEELRVVWKAAEANGMFGAFIRFALLTGQRRTKIASMKWEDLKDGVWTIPSAKREKGNAGELVLPVDAISILDSLPRFTGNPYVFTNGGNYLTGHSEAKRKFDAKVQIAHWQLHDLRRTARSLMSRAGVKPLIAELTLGHVQKGISAIYDRHEYRDEKADALKRLAGLIELTVNPPASNVVSMTKN